MDQKEKKISIELSNDNLMIDDARKFVSSPNCGAISMFLGTTRINENNDLINDKNVQSLYYEAYNDMAISIMNEIVNDILEKQNNTDQLHTKIYIRHKIGNVPLGEISIIIAISSPHRQTSHQMVMEILNKIKQNVPIWKKIKYDNNCIDEWSDKSEAFWLKN